MSVSCPVELCLPLHLRSQGHPSAFGQSEMTVEQLETARHAISGGGSEILVLLILVLLVLRLRPPW